MLAGWGWRCLRDCVRPRPHTTASTALSSFPTTRLVRPVACACDRRIKSRDSLFVFSDGNVSPADYAACGFGLSCCWALSLAGCCFRFQVLSRGSFKIIGICCCLSEASHRQPHIMGEVCTRSWDAFSAVFLLVLCSSLPDMWLAAQGKNNSVDVAFVCAERPAVCVCMGKRHQNLLDRPSHTPCLCSCSYAGVGSYLFAHDECLSVFPCLLWAELLFSSLPSCRVHWE